MLFLDDERNPNDVTWIVLEKGQYDIVRSFDEFKTYVLFHGIPSVISFDNDLGGPCSNTVNSLISEATDAFGTQDYPAIREIADALYTACEPVREGIDCAKWLVEMSLDGKLDFPKDFRFTVHSKNPVAKDRIIGLLDSYLRSIAEP